IAIARGLGEAHVKATAAATGNVYKQAIEDLAAPVIAIEAEIHHGAEEAAALGPAESVSAFQRDVRDGRPGYVAAVTQPGNHVAYSGEAGPGHGRVLGGVDQLVNAARIEAILRHDGGAVFDVPVGAWNGGARTFHLVADGEAEIRVIGIQNRVGFGIAVGHTVASFLAIRREFRAHDPLDALCDRRIEIH